MKAIDFIKNKFKLGPKDKSPFEISNVKENDLSLWLKEIDVKEGVFVGAKDGEKLSKYCKNNPKVKFWATDSWKPYMDDHDIKKSTYEKLHFSFKKKMTSFSNYEVLKKFSMDAVLKFRKNSLDFVFINANPKEPYISQDMEKWYERLKPGGIIAGSNYVEKETDQNGVKSAFGKFIGKEKIKNSFLLGSKSKKIRTWMIIKNEEDTLSFITNKFNLDLSKTSPILVSCNRYTELPKLFKELGFEYGAEVGVLNGEYSEVLVKSIPNLKLYAIDAWKFYPVFKNFRKQKHHDQAYNIAKKRLSKYKNIKIVKKWSVDAAKDFKDESLDFVYIDADHSFPAVTKDLDVWVRKVKKGGIIAGHDFSTSKNREFGHVRDVVCSWTKAYGIHPLFELENPPDFKENSWMWVKQ